MLCERLSGFFNDLDLILGVVSFCGKTIRIRPLLDEQEKMEDNAKQGRCIMLLRQRIFQLIEGYDRACRNTQISPDSRKHW